MNRNIIANRKLFLSGKKNIKFNVSIYKPFKVEEDFYKCRVIIEGKPENFVDVEFGGQDSYQALSLAMQSISNLTKIYNTKLNSKLRWNDGDEDLGFSLDLFKKKIKKKKMKITKKSRSKR